MLLPSTSKGHPLSCRPQAKGFTVLEMIVAIVIVGIVSAVAFSRFVDGNAFNPVIVRDQLISLARIAQQSALGRENVQLSLTPSVDGGLLLVEVTESLGAVPISTEIISLESVALAGDIDVTDSCSAIGGSVALTNSTPLKIDYAALGAIKNISGIASGAVSSAVRICINNSAIASVCISPSGFAYAGDCDD